MKRKALSVAVRGIIGAAAAATMLPASVFAQNDSGAPATEEVFVTGTSIAREDLESAIPIQLISNEDIQRSGVTSTAELVRKLPAMQGFLTPADSAGGSGGGIVTANLRDLGDQYTLVLLNGRRLAPATSGSDIDLSNIPLSAIERVEILTDGASALYGSDAIAGVINFILKDSFEGVSVSARFDTPEQSGGASSTFDITAGFGDRENDKFSVVASLSHSTQEQLKASDRDFAKTGMLTFWSDAHASNVYFFNGSGNAIPGNARVRYTDGTLDDDGELVEHTLTFSPYKLGNGGNCTSNTSAIDDECWFDYTSTIEIVPEVERTSLYVQGNLDINDDLEAFATISSSNSVMTARIAPYPTGYITLPNDASVVVDNVLPHLPGLGVDLTDPNVELANVAGRWRALPAGNRTTEYDTTAFNVVTGLRGTMGDISYEGALTVANTKTEQSYPTGWLLLDEFRSAAGAGAFNIFASADEFTDADMAALAPGVYSGHWDTVDVGMTALDAKAVMPIFEMDGGEAQLAAGMDYRTTSYKRTISEANANELLLFLGKDTAYDMERSQYGLFTEVLLPVSDNLEFNASLRYDQIGAVSDGEQGGGDINDSDSDLTYKVSMHWSTGDTFSFRASYGTGFKAPSMREIGEPLSDFGVTSGSYACPFPSSDPLSDYCLTGEFQLNVFREGEAKLVAETSTQYSYGFVWTPSDDVSLTVDYWSIEMEDLVDRLTEQQIINNPTTYRDKFTSKTNLGTGEEELAIIQAAVNIGASKNAGIDYRLDVTNDLSFGTLTTTLSGTQVLQSEDTLNGSSLGKFGPDNKVTFRNISVLSTTLTHGDFSHTLAANFRTGYADQAQTVTLVDAQGVQGADVTEQRQIPSYTTFNYQSNYYMLDEKLKLTLGINNLFDEEPPMSLRTGGAGHQIGWDPRYADAYGRTVYFQAGYTF